MTNDLITVTVLDTMTGKRASWDGYSAQWWENGNGSCDCNRCLMFTDIPECDDCGKDGFHCCGWRRFLVVEVSEGDLSAMNQDYPPELVAKHTGG